MATAPPPPPRDLHATCASGTAADVHAIIGLLSDDESAGGDVLNAPNRVGSAPIHVACQRVVSDETLGVIRALVEAGARLDVTARDGSTALHLACARGNFAAVQLLAENGADINAVDKSLRSVLHAAVKQGNLEVVERLIQLGADTHVVDKFGRSLLHVAVQRKSLEAISLLVSAGVDINAADTDGWSLLHVAAMGGSIEVIDALVKEGAGLRSVDENGKTPLYLAVLNGADISVVESLISHGADVNTEDKDKKTLLQYVVEHGTIELLEVLIKHGARINSIDATGRSVLHTAVERGREDMLKFLIEQDIDVNAVDQDGKSILHVAVTQEKPEIVRLLVSRGVDIKAIDMAGRSLLHVAVENLPRNNGSMSMIEFLINSGVDVNSLDSQQETPLHVACYLNRFPEAVWFLLNNGASEALTVEDDDGFCPLHIAAQNLNIDLVKMIMDAGGDVNAPCRGGETALAIAFFVFNTNCDHAYPIAHELCSRGAEWDATCDERLSQGRTRAKDALEKSEQKDPVEAQEELRQELRQELRWRLGLRECVLHWTAQRHACDFDLVDVPTEVINQGPASVRTYIEDLAKTSIADLVYRRKICVVGPSEWGKTSLVKSLTTLKPSLVHKDDRTIGIDLEECVIDNSSSDPHTQLPRVVGKRRHEVTFWDFAGQEIYQVAHSLFYSKRTLYLICVDLESYAQTLEEASTMSLRQGEAAIARFVRRHIFRWIRSIFSRQPDAEFVVVGTKSDQLKGSEVAVEIWRDLRMHLSDWQRKFVEELEKEHQAAQATLLTAPTAKSYKFLRAGKSDVLAQLEALKAKVIHTVSDDWLVVSSAEYSSVLSAREALAEHLEKSDRCFQMTVTYRRVLEIIKTRRRDARAMENAQDRIENTILPYKALLRVILREVDDLKEGDCASILRTLHELGDILWYEREGAGALKDTVIIDPTLVLDFVREVVNHRRELDQHADKTVDEKAGRVTHATLSQFPLWRELDQELLHAFKLLLQYFQLAYPADGKEMDWDSDLIVPTYWKQQPSGNKADADSTQEDDFFERHGYTSTDASGSICWEYELSSDVSETVFEHFAVQSYSALFSRTVRQSCIESFVDGVFASRIELRQEDRDSRDVIRIQAITPASLTTAFDDYSEAYERSWHCLRYFVMTMEKVLDAYSGLTASRYIVDMTQYPTTNRHRVNSAVKTLEDAVSMGRDISTIRVDRPWLPKDLNWYIEKAWRQPGALQDLRTRTLLKELFNKADVLKKLLVAGDTQRRYPALWTLKIKADTNVAELRMLSDLSGNCFHEPLQFALPSAFLAKHGSIFKVGLSICANVVPSVLSLGILNKVIAASSSLLGDQVDQAVHVYNVIDQLDTASLRVQHSSSSERLSPRRSIAILRELLVLCGENVDELMITDLANLQCAATQSGHYIWANRQEIMAMGDRLTPCDPGRDPELRVPTNAKAPSLLLRAPPPTTTLTTSSTATSPSLGPLRLVIEGVEGMPAWDWRRVYCKWQVVHSKSKSPLASGATSQHMDESSSPAWNSMFFTLSSIPSLDTLRECRLEVEVKRPSRLLGMTKSIGQGSVALSQVLAPDSQHSDRIEVPLDGDKTQRLVVCQLSEQA